jgi:drug/metabolite transporter (DMT)-like permease
MRSTYWILVVVAALGWGSGGIATRGAFAEGVGIWTLVALRVAIAALLVLAVLVARRSPLPTVVVLKYGLSQAVFNLTIPYVLFTFALDEASAGFVGLLTALIPLATSLFANFMLRDESMNPRKFIALLVGFTGVAALMLSGDSGLPEGGRPLIAIGLGLTSVVSVGYAGAFAKKHAGSYDPIMLSGIQFGFAAVWLVTAMFAIEGAPIGISANGWWLIMILAIAATFMPFLLFFWLLQHISVTNASLVGYIVPFVALIGGVVLLDEQLQPGIVVGGSLVAAGMFLSDRESRRSSSAVSHQPTTLN